MSSKYKDAAEHHATAFRMSVRNLEEDEARAAIDALLEELIGVFPDSKLDKSVNAAHKAFVKKVTTR